MDGWKLCAVKFERRLTKIPEIENKSEKLRLNFGTLGLSFEILK